MRDDRDPWPPARHRFWGVWAVLGLLVLGVRIGPVRHWLHTNGRQDGYPCAVAQQRFADGGLQNEAAVEALLRERLYSGNVRPEDPVAAWAAELRSGPVGVPVPAAQLRHTVPTYVQPPPDHSPIDDLYALVGVDDDAAHPGLGYLITYGKHQGLDPSFSLVPPGLGIELVKRCSIRTANGRTEATVYAGSVSSRYQLRVGKP